MRVPINYVNIVISDNNRKVNWDFRDNKPLEEALKWFGFKWNTGSIRVNGHSVTDNKLFMSLASFVEASEMCGDDCHGRLFVTMKRPKEGDA